MWLSVVIAGTLSALGGFLTCEGHGVLVLSGDLENTFLLFFFMDEEALQSCFIFKALDVLNEDLFFCVNKGKDTPQPC